MAVARTVVYEHNKENTVRYALGYRGKNTLACMGLNPSTATPEKLDPTMQSVNRIARNNGYDGWVMFNLYPLRATKPGDLPMKPDQELLLRNEAYFQQLIKEQSISTLWLAYGNLIETRSYLQESLQRLLVVAKNQKVDLLCVGEPTKKGHPRHPLYQPAKANLKPFVFPQK